MPTGYFLGEAIWESGETMTGPTVSWLIRQSEKHRVWLGTSFLEVEGEHFYNSFVLANPKGQVAGKVRKDAPTSCEAYFFKVKSTRMSSTRNSAALASSFATSTI
jgi:N-carbamoylputrescine amidase